MDGLRVDFGDGVSALERTSRSIVMIVGQAVDQLVQAGYGRDDIEITIHEEGLPLRIRLLNEDVFELAESTTDGVIAIRGTWLRNVGPKKPKRRSFWDWLLRRK